MIFLFFILFIKSEKSVSRISFLHRSDCWFVNVLMFRELRNFCFSTLVFEEFCLKSLPWNTLMLLDISLDSVISFSLTLSFPTQFWSPCYFQGSKLTFPADTWQKLNVHKTFRDVQYVFGTSCIRSFYTLCLRGCRFLPMLIPFPFAPHFYAIGNVILNSP